ncbi:MAG: 1-acyl-sn-glycerol-3-phosphate acyltransferase [Planctomycetes bacterium]|nr:1-acyl-sn-glycerol-3-phosphate acyltransferase [Planctomycetota bacterium]
MVIANHPSYLDPPFIILVSPRPVHFMTWAAAFSNPRMDRFLRWWGAFPVDLAAPGSAPVRHAMRLLKAGRVVGVCPEGERSIGPFLRPELMKRGAVQMALALDAPIVPVSVVGAFGLWPAFRKLPHAQAVRVIFHPPLTPSKADRDRRRSREHQAALLRHLADVINAPIREYYAGRLAPDQVRRYERRSTTAHERSDAAFGIAARDRLGSSPPADGVH